MKERLRKNRGKEPCLGSGCSELGNVMSMAVEEMEKKQTLELFSKEELQGERRLDEREKRQERAKVSLFINS